MEDNEDFDASKNKELLLMSHVTQKGVQAGSLLSLVLSLPVLALRRRLGVEGILGWTSNGVLIGAGLTTALGMYKMSGLEPEGIEDRAYRLHYNQGQNRVDRFCQVGAVLGAGTALVMSQIKAGPAVMQTLTWRTVLGSAAVGTALGVLSHVATSKASARPTGMIKELE